MTTPRSSTPGRRPASDVTLAEVAYTHVRRKIIDGRYLLGDTLSSRGIAAELKVSFLPVLTALQRLQEEGLVESRPRVGTRVVVPSEAQVLGMHHVREALECQAARLCAAGASASQRAALVRLAARVDEADRCCTGPRVSRSLQVRAHQLHARLHLSIATFSRCVPLVQAIERSQILTFKIQLDHADSRRELPPYRHIELIDAVVSGTPAQADAAMRDHLAAGLPGTLALVRQLAQADQWRRGAERISRVNGNRRQHRDR